MTKSKQLSKTQRKKSRKYRSQSQTKPARSNATKSAQRNTTTNVSPGTRKKPTTKSPTPLSPSTNKTRGTRSKGTQLTAVEQQFYDAFEREYQKSELAIKLARKRGVRRAAPAVVSPVVTRQRAGESARSAAARKGWTTRRANEARTQRHTYKANPNADEITTGDFAYTLYNTTHPLTGEQDAIDLWDARVGRYYGHTVRLSLNGFRVNPDTDKRVRIFIRRSGYVESYGDVFGPGSLYARAIRVVRNRASNDALVIVSISFDIVDGIDSADSEDFAA